MELYFGTYSGQVLNITNFPSSFQLKKSTQISTGSIRSMNIIEKFLIIGTFEQQLKVVDLQSGRQILEEKHNIGVISNICRLSNQDFVFGGKNGSLKFMKTQSWVLKKQCNQNKKAIVDIITDKDHKIVITASQNKIIFWNVHSMSRAYQYKLSYNIQGIMSSQSFQSLFVVTQKDIHELSTQDNSELALINVNDHIQTWELYQHYIIVTTSSGMVKIWRIGYYQHSIYFQAHDSRVKVCKVIESNGDTYLITGSSTGNLRAWDVMEFLKQVDQISQDYHLEGLKPLFQIQLNHRLLCMAYTMPNQTKKIKKIDKQIEKIRKKQTKTNQFLQQPLKKKKKIKKQQYKQKRENDQQYAKLNQNQQLSFPQPNQSLQ